MRERPIKRQELIGGFELEGVDSSAVPMIKARASAEDPVALVETWQLEHGYRLEAVAEEIPNVSEESKRKADQWQRQATSRDFFVLERDPVESFATFELYSPRGKRVYSER